MEKPQEMVWVRLQVEWGSVSESHQGGANNVSQVDGDSGIVPTSWLCVCGMVGGGAVILRKVTTASASTFA